MTSSTFKSRVEITHIGTATAIVSVDGINFLTDPFFSPVGSTWDYEHVRLENTESPALTLTDLPVIDAVLLSHEDHPDNLEELGQPPVPPAVHGLHPWETIQSTIGGKEFSITGVPCVHVPNNECIGFILTTASFGKAADGRPNVIYFSGDTVYFEELVQMKDKFHISVALYNLGAAHVPAGPGGSMLQITMCGEQGARLFKETGADVLVSMHYMSWKHFTQFDKELHRESEEAGVLDKVCWLEPGVAKRII